MQIENLNASTVDISHFNFMFPLWQPLHFKTGVKINSKNKKSTTLKLPTETKTIIH